MMKVIGINRHRLASDGKGVTTLVGNSYCNLGCKYCLNKIHKDRAVILHSPESLLEEVKIDDLYFSMTSGGITFGGGEPLLDIGFIEKFVALVKNKGYDWKISVESAINVPLCVLKRALKVVDYFIIDVKAIDNLIYKKYTGVSNELVMNNLHYIGEQIMCGNISADNFLIRIPIIPNYSGDLNALESKAYLRLLGFKNFDIFKYVIRD